MYLLTASALTVKRRLDKTKSILELEKEVDQKHIFDIMKYVDTQVNGCPYSSLKNKLEMSNTYLAQYAAWLKKNGYLMKAKRKMFLREKGKKALIELYDFFSSAETSLRFVWETSDLNRGEATINAKIGDVTKNAIFSNKLIQQKIIELSAFLANFPEGVNLNIEVPPIESKKILALLKLFWDFYWSKVTDLNCSISNFASLSINLQLTNDNSLARYSRFWKAHLERYDDLKDSIIDCQIVDKSNNKITSEYQAHLFPLLPKELESCLPYFIEDYKTRQWIESRLEQDQDWFMPHPVWVKLGFKQRREDLSVDSIERVSPPIFHKIISHQLPLGYGLFDSILKYMVQKGEEGGVEAFCLWIQDADWKVADFYESWKLLRKEYRFKIENDPQLKKVADVLDCALIEYIKAKRSPNVDLYKVFVEYLQIQDHTRVIEQIRVGTYSINNSALDICR